MSPQSLSPGLISLCLLMLPGPLVAGPGESDHDHEHRQHKRQHSAHVHGIGAVNLVLEGQDLHVEFVSPAANIVGFEHAPDTEADHAAVGHAVTLLKRGDRLFRFSDAAACRIDHAGVSSALIEDQSHGHANEHPFEETAGAGHEHAGEAHAEFEAVYHFVCAEPGALGELRVGIFEAFPATERLTVQHVIGDRQGAAELTAANHVLKF